MEFLGSKIKMERTKMNINQVELAKIMNVSKQTVSNWEKGTRIPETSTLCKLAKLFDVSTDYLLGWNQINNTKSEDLVNKLNSLDEADFKAMEQIINSLIKQKRNK